MPSVIVCSVLVAGVLPGHWAWCPVVPLFFMTGSLRVFSFVLAQEIGTTVHKLLLRMISKSDVNEVSGKVNLPHLPKRN